MVSPSTWLRYISSKLEYSVSLSHKELLQVFFRGTTRKVFWGSFPTLGLRILCACRRITKGDEMAPTIGTQGGTLLVRKIPDADPMQVYVGDVVVLKDPTDSEKYLVRRLAAIEGYEMASTDVMDEPFVLEKGQCWVLADNENVKPKEAYDSRTFGPVTMADIVGRVIYCLRSAVDHGPVNNSHFSTKKDSPVLEVELDVEEMARNHKA